MEKFRHRVKNSERAPVQSTTWLVQASEARQRAAAETVIFRGGEYRYGTYVTLAILSCRAH